ncbi:MAG: triose-phosphate isomerase [Nanohaloarchaea archaeon SW_4_43_9]|nr:MAG: triose-phosphate isomerase [Nanohaloarchaea archaeon SW_4_43_9]
MIIVNFKAYSEAEGDKARELAEKCRQASQETGKKVIVCPSAQDISKTSIDGIRVFSQNVDPVKPGSHTGSITAEGVKKAGVSGTLLNHSEKRMKKEEIKASIELCQEHELITVVCAQSPEECAQLSKFEPDYIAFEPPELIGGNTSVSEAKPEVIEEAVRSSSVPVLTGAGIKTRKDVEKSIELGCEGVLVASGVVKADNVLKEVKELCQGL